MTREMDSIQVGRCDFCGDPIYDDEQWVTVNGKRYHKECADESYQEGMPTEEGDDGS